MLIRELRDQTGMTQMEFATAYGIPVSTLRKWEQGETTPAEYVVRLIARTLPGMDARAERITDAEGRSYFYNRESGEIVDEQGARIRVGNAPDGVKRENLSLYVHDLFAGLYEAQRLFELDCEYDKKEGIVWI